MAGVLPAGVFVVGVTATGVFVFALAGVLAAPPAAPDALGVGLGVTVAGPAGVAVAPGAASPPQAASAPTMQAIAIFCIVSSTMAKN